MRPLSDIPDPDDLAGLAWYYWLFIGRVRSVNATAEEKQLLLSEIELWFNAARRKCLASAFSVSARRDAERPEFEFNSAESPATRRAFCFFGRVVIAAGEMTAAPSSSNG